jgi:hypothetical protein
MAFPKVYDLGKFCLVAGMKLQLSGFSLQLSGALCELATATRPGCEHHGVGEDRIARSAR